MRPVRRAPPARPRSHHQQPTPRSTLDPRIPHVAYPALMAKSMAKSMATQPATGAHHSGRAAPLAPLESEQPAQRLALERPPQQVGPLVRPPSGRAAGGPVGAQGPRRQRHLVARNRKIQTAQNWPLARLAEAK